MENEILKLIEFYIGNTGFLIETLPISGSARKYYRIYDEQKKFIAVFNDDLNENNLFISFSENFRIKGLKVPEIYCVSGNRKVYFQEDLGNNTLLSVIEKEDGNLSEKTLELYQSSLSELLRFQFEGGKDLDYSNCMPRESFDEQSFQWDLNYFKYCFLKLGGIPFDENKLEEDFAHLITRIKDVPASYFMFRDFQSRNIMVVNDEVYFIDYQGGKKGALQYDVASLLYDAVVNIPEHQKSTLLNYYIRELQDYDVSASMSFMDTFYDFVLLRLLQALGAFGLRGLHEGKQHFIDSIVPGLESIIELFENAKLSGEYPEILRVVESALKKYLLPLQE